MKQCPRCLEQTLHEEQERNSYSRFAPVYICVTCGHEEQKIAHRMLEMKGPIRLRHRRMLDWVEPSTAKEE
jgi:Zn ribbon nucleic-acid-binding protein